MTGKLSLFALYRVGAVLCADAPTKSSGPEDSDFWL